MTTSECIRPEEWGSAETWAADDPRRRHVEGCARCQAQRAAYREMLDDRTVPAGADPAAAAHAMRRAFGAELSPSPRRSERRFFDALFARPALSVAVGFAAVVALWISLAPPGRDAPDVLRGTQSTPALECSVEVRDSVAELSWEALPRADAYAVTIFDDGLAEIRRIDPIPASVHATRIDLREAPFASTSRIYWQVAARAGTQTIALSAVRPVPLERP